MVKEIYLVRHGETDWSESGKHTGKTDVSLTERGKSEALSLKSTLQSISFDHIFTSPLKRATETATAVGLSATLERDLMEWDYGNYEGMTTLEIHQENPGWTIFTQGAPGGESITDVEHRADRLLGKLMQLEGRILLFSHAHFLRSLASRWIGLPVTEGAHFVLFTGSVSVLGFERERHAIVYWNHK